MTNFPQWNTPSTLSPVTQGSTVLAILTAAEMTSVDGFAGSNSIYPGENPGAAAAISVSVNGQTVGFAVSGANLVLSETFPANFTATVSFGSSGLSYSLLNGVLPPGLTLGAAGTITGTVGTITATTQTYVFTVRVSDGSQVRDRQFSLVANGTREDGTINTTGLSNLVFVPSLGIQAYDLGSYDLSGAFVSKIGVTNPDNVPERLTVFTVPDVSFSSSVFDGLPPGVTVSGTVVEGIISPGAAPGLYVFGLNLSNSSSSIICTATVHPTISPTVAIIPAITWITPEGSMGAINEGENSSFAIRATVTGVASFKYALAPYSGPLPPGLVFDNNTGNIYGIPAHVDHDTIYPFTVRITIGNYFENRDFSILVRQLYTTVGTLTLYLNPFSNDETKLLQNYSSIITPKYLYRTEDPNFGLTSNASVYLVGDLDPSNGIDNALNGDGFPHIYRPDYHAPVNLILSDHKSAVVRDGAGTVVYEVIYRELIDPLNKAGGFAVVGGIPVQTNLVWPDSTSPKLDFYPSSLTNIRYDLISNLGFPVPDATLAHSLVSENMPQWMTAEQTAGDSTTVLGYVPAFVLAYLSPGYSEAVLTRIQQNSTRLLPNGYVFSFDRYYAATMVATAQTSYDAGTTFDSAITIFDQDYIPQGKYYEPTIGNTI